MSDNPCSCSRPSCGYADSISDEEDLGSKYCC